MLGYVTSFSAMTTARVAAVGMLLPSAGDCAGGPSQIFKDWEVACDNTLHCEAVGFAAEDAEAAVSLWLGRDAGPGAPVTARVSVAVPEGQQEPAELTLKVGEVVVAGVVPDTGIPAATIGPALPRLLEAASALISDGRRKWTLSLAGAKAALLKIDDVQGRVDTPGALVRKGTKAEASVRPALPPAPVRATVALPDKAGDEKLIAPILQAVRERTCWEDQPDSDQPATEIHRLSGSQVLVMRECGRAAYQSNWVAWIAADRPPHAPVQAVFPTATGEPGYLMNASFEAGTMSAYAKGRGIGDCGSSSIWVWTGQGFALLDASVAMHCRGIAGGVPLRTWVGRKVP